MPRDAAHWLVGEEVVLLPIGDRALNTTRVDMWDAMVQQLGRDLFGVRVIVARVVEFVTPVVGYSNIKLTLENGSSGVWPAERLVPVSELAPIGLDRQALERWLESP